jgi:hypothetical protein
LNLFGTQEVLVGRRSSKEFDERLAAGVLASVLGVRVRIHDDGSMPSMYDLDVIYPDGRVAVAEVVSARNEQAESQMFSAHRRGHVRSSSMTMLWWVQVTGVANLKRIQGDVERFLVELEKRGARKADRDVWGSGDWQRLNELDIDACWAIEPTERHPPGFYLWPMSRGGSPGDGERMLRKLREFWPTVEDVPSKLRASGAFERHAVVMVPAERFDWLLSIEEAEVPQAPPELPDGVDRIWMITLKAPPVQAVYWSGEGGWQRADLTEEQLRAGGSS